MKLSSHENQGSRPDPDERLGPLLLASLVTAVVMAALLLYILAPKDQIRSKGLDECREGYAGSCPTGLECVAGKCLEPEDTRPFCGEGAPCGSGECVCGYPRVCEDGRCGLPALEEDVVCDESPATRLLVKLDSLYTKCVSENGGNDLVSCSASDVKRFLIEGDDFDSVLREFGEVFLVVFPEGKPHATLTDAQFWPDNESLEHYLGLIRERRDVLFSGKRVIVVGRASKSRNQQEDYLYAQARIAFVVDRLQELMQMPADGEEQTFPRLLNFAVGSDNRLTLEYLKDYPIRVVGWRSREERMIGEALEALKGGEGVDDATRRELESLLNRSVLMVIVPCELPEAAK